MALKFTIWLDLANVEINGKTPGHLGSFADDIVIPSTYEEPQVMLNYFEAALKAKSWTGDE